MELNELWNAETAGIGLVIDDELDDKKANIQKIVSNIKKHHIPLVLSNELPDITFSNNLNSISFIILDWELSPEIQKLKRKGISIPQSLLEENKNKIIEFLNYIKNNIFCPVFILSNENINNIRSYLEEKGLINDNQTNFILIKSKSNTLYFRSIKSHIQKWIRNSPPLYVLHMYENALAKAKNETFATFYNLSKSWPIVLYNNAQKDKIDYSTEIMTTISKNIETRMPRLSLHENIFKRRKKIESKEIQKVIEGQTFIENTKLKEEDLDVGDLFLEKVPGGKRKYFINIRPTCSLRPSKGASIDSVELYLLKGEEYKIPKGRSVKKELIREGREGHSYSKIYCVYNGKHISFKFNDLCIKTYEEMKNKRIGRIIPPYITELRSKYTTYLNRQGLPRIPLEIKNY